MSHKTVFTLNINYPKEITNITYPFIEQYTRKIGADFHIIDKRKFPDMPIVYEKFQIYTLASDWNIYIDSDALIHPDTFDITQLLPEDTVMTCGQDFAPIRFKYDKYFQRDGRHIGGGNWFTVASSLCTDLWHPLDIPLHEAVKNIYPTILEKNGEITPAHLIDDYTISRNIAKYGLKFTSFVAMLEKYNKPGEFLFHEYLYTTKEKIANLHKVLDYWRGNA
jgi:hypothetical protein